jgi:hypothetical protein
VGGDVSIDITTPLSPGWWMNRLNRKLLDQKRLERLGWLDRYYCGNADLPCGVESAREAFDLFQRKARSNFAELIVAALVDREHLVGFRTAADDDETGDKEATNLWKRSELNVVSAEVHLLAARFGEAYTLTGPVDDETDSPLVTAEDPRNIVGEPDPVNPRRLRAAFKTIYDDIEQVSKAYLYLKDHVWVATQKGKSGQDFPLAFDERNWTLSEELSGPTPGGRMPAVRFDPNDGFAEFETHRDVIDRINDQILQRMVIATMQAFRQRAIKGLPLTYPAGHAKAGQTIDYSDVFTADPAALWQLPETADMWESGQVDLTPILSAVKDDVGHLAALTRTPMYMLMPEGANQSAEGAQTAREGLVFKAENRIDRLTPSWARVVSGCFAVLGDDKRADLAALSPIWRSAERLSLAERADAASKATDIPWRTKMIRIWGFTPAEVDRMEVERTDDIMLESQFATAAAAAQPAPNTQPTPGGQPSPQDNTVPEVKGAPVPTPA